MTSFERVVARPPRHGARTRVPGILVPADAEPPVNAARYLDKLLGPASLGKTLAATREADGIGQAELARRLGVSRANLCDIEKGRKLVSPDRAARFARALGYPEALYVQLALQDQVRQAGLRLHVDVRAA